MKKTAVMMTTILSSPTRYSSHAPSEFDASVGLDVPAKVPEVEVIHTFARVFGKPNAYTK